ncbi:MAG: hypothetical protein ABSE49_15140 [Polyangiaceae bacterium]|jgi:hypothetical protein
MSNDPNPYAPPQQPFAPLSPAPRAERGGCLTAFLVLVLIANPLVALGYFLAGDAMNAVTRGHDWARPVLGLMCLVNVACAVGVWRFKRWGVYGFVAMAALGLVVNLTLGVGVGSFLGAFVGPAILVALVRPLWSRFR